jgi:hypothetical protein
VDLVERIAETLATNMLTDKVEAQLRDISTMGWQPTTEKRRERRVNFGEHALDLSFHHKPLSPSLSVSLSLSLSLSLSISFVSFVSSFRGCLTPACP